MISRQQRRLNDGAEALKWLGQEGIVFYTEPVEIERAKEYLRDVSQVFPDLVAKLSAFYLFAQEEQPGDTKTADGVLWWKETPHGILYCMGLAVEAMDRGRDYFIGLILHELAHLTNGPHTEEAFYSYLDEMAAQYRAATGEPIFPDHHDFEPDAPPSGPGRPRKTTFSSLGGHSAEDARRKMIARQYRKDHRGA